MEQCLESFYHNEFPHLVDVGWLVVSGGKQARSRVADVDDFINTSPPQGAPIYSIKEYKTRLNAGDPMEKLSPLEGAREIRAYANTALGTDIHMGKSEELRLISNDIKALGYLGLYFAEKIEGAVYHHLGQKDDAISHMQKAYWHWKSYTEIGDAMYKDQRLLEQACSDGVIMTMMPLMIL